MTTYSYEYRIRAEQNKELLKQAAFERWLSSIGPLRTSKERLGRRLLRQAREWLDTRQSTILCNEALPACGLTLGT